jgi:hypothetical protein
MDYLMYAYLQAGENGKAAQLLQELNSMEELPVSQFKVGYAATAMPVRFAVERREWAEAAAIPPREGSPPQVLAIVYWCHAMALARSGTQEDATPQLEKLNHALQRVRENGDDYWAAQIEIQMLEAKAWIARSAGRPGDAVSMMRAAAEKEDGLEKRPITPGPIVPAREQFGDLLLELDRPGEALREFDASLRQAPRRRGSLGGAARAAELSGEQAKADQYRKELQEISAGKTN